MQLPGLVCFAKIEYGPIHIGFTTKQPRSLVDRLKTLCPYPIKLLGTLPGTELDSKGMRYRLRSFDMHGGWFRPWQKVLQAVEDTLDPGFKWPVVDPSIEAMVF